VGHGKGAALTAKAQQICGSLRFQGPIPVAVRSKA
jgi:hypothetical protein